MVNHGTTKTVRAKHNLHGAAAAAATSSFLHAANSSASIGIRGSSKKHHLVVDYHRPSLAARPQSSYKIKDGKLMINVPPKR